MSRPPESIVAQQRFRRAVLILVAGIWCVVMEACCKLQGWAEAAELFCGGATVALIGGSLMALSYGFTKGGRRGA